MAAIRMLDSHPAQSSGYTYDDDAPESAPPKSGFFPVAKNGRSRSADEVHHDAEVALARLEAAYAPLHAGDAALARLANRYGRV